MNYRTATLADIETLAELNHQLIADEGADNPRSVAQLAERMAEWLEGRYRAVLFEEGGAPVAYALYRDDGESIYLRQFFVTRERRRTGVGRDAIARLVNEVFPPGKRVVVEVLAKNARAMAFWHAMGFVDYFMTLERPAA